ncbi:MAG: ABC transporter ATP-binding protein [Bifidobacteriaceae bacterium]|jgi:thiamine transport system ATP-binding protein|nr:ABC transporter ATP-binding protein [Bifidobacteriaceae bacterium]
MVTNGLTLADVSVRFSSTLAVNQVSLSVSRGQILALLGPSGCGKSTLLRAITGLEPLANGQICWDGQDLADIPTHRRGFGLVFQDGQLFDHLSVARNIAYGLHRFRPMPSPQRRARVSELLALVGLKGQAKREPASLSGGEQQRVALARALAPHPRLLLMDEPFAALDSALRTHLAEEVAAILHAEQVTAIVVTHDQDEAFAVADRIGVMSRGKLLDIGVPERLWTWPANQAVAQFLGCRWFIRGKIAGQHLETAWGEVSLPARICQTDNAADSPSNQTAHLPNSPASASESTGQPQRVLVGLRPGSIVITVDLAAQRALPIRRQRGDLSAQIEIPGLGQIEARVAMDAPHPISLDPAKLAVIPAPAPTE